MIDEQNFHQPLQKDLRAYSYIQKIVTGQGDDYIIGCLLDSKEHFKMISLDLSKQQALDADPKAIQQSNFTRYVERYGQATMFFITEEVRNQFRFFTWNSEGVVILFCFNMILA